MGARTDRADDLLWLGRREDKLHMLGRLFDDLEQRVEALSRDHVSLVDDVDLVSRGRRRKEGPVTQLACVVNTTMAGGVNLNHIDGARAPARKVLATLAFTTRLGSRAFLAVEAPRQDS